MDVAIASACLPLRQPRPSESFIKEQDPIDKVPHSRSLFKQAVSHLARSVEQDSAKD